jgi:hypothetical protein
MPEPNTPNDRAAQQKLDQISTKVATRGLDIPSKQELCEIYKSVKPLIDDVLPWIEKLPKGKQIADAIRFLGKIADTVCA